MQICTVALAHRRGPGVSSAPFRNYKHGFIILLSTLLTECLCCVVWVLDSVEVSNYYSHFHTLCPSGSLSSEWSMNALSVDCITHIIDHIIYAHIHCAEHKDCIPVAIFTNVCMCVHISIHIPLQY